jgi:glycosyltransferase involved in cell wall biosynthesis
MRLGLDTSFLDRPPSGIGAYTAALREWIPVVAPDIELVEIRPSPNSPVHRLGARGSRFTWEVLMAGLRARRSHVDLLHMPMMTSPLLAGVPIITTVHDVIPYVMPEYQGSRAQLLNLAVARRLITRSAAIIAPSHHAAGDIARTLGIPLERIAVTYEAAEEAYCPLEHRATVQPVLDRNRISGPFIFNIGGLDVRKNLALLLNAFARILDRIPETIQLVIGGAAHRGNPRVYPPLEPVVADLGLGERVVLTGRVSEEDKIALMQAAALYVTPSLYEGFGLSVVEAMACGVPAIAANRSSLPEVAGGAALLVEPEVEPLAAAILSVLTNPGLAADLRTKGLRRAQDFSWQATAAQTVAVYRQVLRGQGAGS